MPGTRSIFRSDRYLVLTVRVNDPDADLLVLETRLMRCELVTLSLVALDFLRRKLPSSVLELKGRRRVWGTLRRAEAGLLSFVRPRAGPPRSLVLIGRKGRFALWMNPLPLVYSPVSVRTDERAVRPRTCAPATLTPSGWDLTKLFHELSQALP